jgi:hypothetical protein
MSPPVHLLLDLENVQPSAEELGQVRGGHYRLWILHGSHQKHFTADRASAWQPLGKQVRFVQSAKQGKNALDLHIAFCMGEAAEHDRAAGAPGCYVVVSKDTGFDALFGYLSGRGVRVGRATTLPGAISLANDLLKGVVKRSAPAPKPASPDVVRIVDQFRAHPRQKPRTEKRLYNYVGSFLAKDSGGDEVRRIVSELKGSGIVTQEGASVRYRLPPKSQIVGAVT